MGKYSGKTSVKSTHRQLKSAPVKTGKKTATTFEGDAGHVRKPKGELFVLAVNFMGEQESTFYETGFDRHTRFVDLIHKVTKKDAAWMQQFIPFLRNEAFMRTASIVCAAEYVRAGGPNGAAVVDSAIRRSDEAAEVIAYWTAKYGRQIPFAIRKGVNRAVQRVYNEFSALKYDGGTRGVRMGDVIELCHPKPVAPWQSDLFRYLLDRRHNPTDVRVTFDNLPKIAQWRFFQDMPRDDRRAYLRTHGAQALADAGITWEVLSEWLPGGMDREAWEWMIPSMGYMALLRNLRNFDEAGVSDEVAADVVARLSDPEQVARSMQFPFRFLSAYKEVPSNRWALALDKALDFSTANIPRLKGRSLVLVDVSGSMHQQMSNRSKLMQHEAGAVFGVAQFRQAGFEGTLVAFGTDSEEIPLRRGTSVLKGVEALLRVAQSGRVGHGTNTWQAVAKHYDGHDRVFIFTDMQSFGYYGKDAVLDSVKGPIYNWNLAGYRATNMEVGTDNRYEMAGLSDVSFRQVALLEALDDATWPWEAK